MSEEKKLGLSRREFLKDAGLVVGGATIGSMALLSACSCPGGGGEDPSTKVTCPVCGIECDDLDALKKHCETVHPYANLKNLTVFNVNGTKYAFFVGDMELLSTTLRERLGLFGTKVPCDMGSCGGCTVLDGDTPIFSCLTLSIECGGKKITTIEGLSDGVTLNPTQQRFFVQDAFQCGYCTPGFIMAGEGLLRANPSPTKLDAQRAISGHICMCGNIKKVVDALTGDGLAIKGAGSV